MNLNDDKAQSQSTESVADQNVTQTAEQVLDLDGVSSFKFQGETFTPDRLLEVYQGYQKHGEASKYVESDQNYWANVFHDIDKVVKNPQRIDEFKQTYPERFHALLDRALNSSSRAQDPTQQNPQAQNQNGMPKEFLEKFQTLEQKLSAFEQEKYQSQVEAAGAKIDATLPPLLEKYPMADREQVLVAAENAIMSGQKLTDAAWERLVRENHEKLTTRADKFYGARLKEQLNKGKQAQDIGSGGSTPGQAPRKPKTFAEAEAAMIESLRQKQA